MPDINFDDYIYCEDCGSYYKGEHECDHIKTGQKCVDE